MFVFWGQGGGWDIAPGLLRAAFYFPGAPLVFVAGERTGREEGEDEMVVTFFFAVFVFARIQQYSLVHLARGCEPMQMQNLSWIPDPSLWWKASLEALNSSSVCYVTFLAYISLQWRRRQDVRF